MIPPEEYIEVVGFVLRSMNIRTTNYLHDDCESAGMIVLIKVAKVYEPREGCTFFSFARVCVKRGILEVLRKEKREIERRQQQRQQQRKRRMEYDKDSQVLDILCEKEAQKAVDELNGRIICAECKRLCIQRAKRLCNICYDKSRNKNVKKIPKIARKKNKERKCIICSKTKIHQAKGMCRTCYSTFGRPRKVIGCKDCGKSAIEKSQGLCGSCYKKMLIKTKRAYAFLQECIRCGKDRVHEAKGMCSPCYYKVKYQQKKQIANSRLLGSA